MADCFGKGGAGIALPGGSTGVVSPSRLRRDGRRGPDGEDGAVTRVDPRAHHALLAIEYGCS
jgi:hypothetical protein